MKEEKQEERCSKCRKYFVLETHHILPKCTFGENDQTDKLCPNCHAAYHRWLGKEALKNEDMAFHIYMYSKWLAGLISLMLVLYLAFF
jgi:hypothetical protein